MIDSILLFSALMGWMGTETHFFVSLSIAVIVGILFGIIISRNLKFVLVLNSLVFGLVFGRFACDASLLRN